MSDSVQPHRRQPTRLCRPWVSPGKNTGVSFHFFLPCKELTHWKRPWCWERLKAGGEGDNRGQEGWMASLTQWTWVWVSSGNWWWIGRPGVLQSMGSHRDITWLSDWTTTTKTDSPPLWEHPNIVGIGKGVLGAFSQKTCPNLPPKGWQPSSLSTTWMWSLDVTFNSMFSSLGIIPFLLWTIFSWSQRLFLSTCSEDNPWFSQGRQTLILFVGVKEGNASRFSLGLPSAVDHTKTLQGQPLSVTGPAL